MTIIVRRQSPFTGIWHQMTISATAEQLNSWISGEKLIQDAMPHTSPEEREFLITGITPEEWKEIFG